MKINCPHVNCRSQQITDPKINPVVRNGFFYRKSDSRWIRRFYCRNCRSYFSYSTQSPLKYQKKRRINFQLQRLYVSGVSQRRISRLLRLSRRTVAKKIALFSEIESQRQLEFLEKNYKERPLKVVQFDDLETSEHTKCKPLSVSLAVDPETRRILKFKVSSMPARGHLAEISRIKYGRRADERPAAWNALLSELTSYVDPKAKWTSDENPHYPRPLKKHFPDSIHIRVKGGRGAITGQGELKKLKYDPLFSLNHTCAMLRANLNRLFRRTWCTTKKREGLIQHLNLYVSFHNNVLTQPIRS